MVIINQRKARGMKIGILQLEIHPGVKAAVKF